MIQGGINTDAVILFLIQAKRITISVIGVIRGECMVSVSACETIIPGFKVAVRDLICESRSCPQGECSNSQRYNDEFLSANHSNLLVTYFEQQM